MFGVGFRRLFWIGAAALLGLAALISIVALVRGDFTDTDWKILGTLGLALLSGSAALAGLALIERRDLVPLGWTIVAVACVCFVFLTWQTWAEFDSEHWSLDAIIVLIAALMLATSRLLFRSFAWLYWASAALTLATAGVYVWAIHADPSGDFWRKGLGTLGILTVLAWFLVPVLGRTSGKSSERVVGRGPGRVEVDLADGETLVVRSR
jgi:hypothetical protein